MTALFSGDTRITIDPTLLEEANTRMEELQQSRHELLSALRALEEREITEGWQRWSLLRPPDIHVPLFHGAHEFRVWHRTLLASEIYVLFHSSPVAGDTSPAVLPGSICEICFDAPAVTVQPAPWGEMGVCTACQEKEAVDE